MIILNGNLVKPTIFPDKTSQVWKIDPRDIAPRNIIHWNFENEAEIFHLGQLMMLLNSMGTQSELHIPYVPYGRQDKAISNETTFALYTFAHFLNGMGFTRIVTLDAHSGVLYHLMLIPVVDDKPGVFIHRALEDSGATAVGYPDDGAVKRYAGMVEGVAIVTGKKHRDQISGFLKYIGIEGDDVTGKNVLIIDDICDGGMTFIQFAKILYDRGAKEVSLYTTHGIYSKGIQVLRDAGIKRIFNHKGEV